MAKLSHDLIDLGFFCALGTTQRGAGVSFLVEKGIPGRWDRNNGVLVVNDEEGRPWIADTDTIDSDDPGFRALFENHDLERGAHVPHSNDGGHFVVNVMPKLL